jgi:proteic killer suppression protein
MHIRSVRHRGLRRFIEDDDTRGIQSDLVDRARKIVAVLIVVQDMSEVRGPPGWRLHQLVGDRARTWSIAVSGNWRITFDVVDNEFDVSMDMLLRMQAWYDSYAIRQRADDIAVQRYEPA